MHRFHATPGVVDAQQRSDGIYHRADCRDRCQRSRCQNPSVAGMAMHTSRKMDQVRVLRGMMGNFVIDSRMEEKIEH